ncbi:uncharacterized protein LOC144142225 isoform X2 [Haemaphysalis longicornis]
MCQVDLVHHWNSSHIWFKRMFLVYPYKIRNKTIEELLGKIVDWQREPGGTIMMVGFAEQDPFKPFQSEQVLYRDVASVCAVFLVNPMSPYTKNPFYSCELRVKGNTTIKPSEDCKMKYLEYCTLRRWEQVSYKPYCRNMLKNLGW